MARNRVDSLVRRTAAFIMWPFDSNKVEKLVAEALAPGVLPSARKQAIKALMKLPQRPRSLECYSQIALDAKQVRDTRTLAIDAMKLSPNADGVRALLGCVETDLRNYALHTLGEGEMPAAVRAAGPEVVAVLTRVFEQVVLEAGSRQPHGLLLELGTLNSLCAQIGSPEARALQARLDPVWLQVRSREVPGLLQRALTSQYHDQVAEAVKKLERLSIPEARAALEEFRRQPSRLVEKTVIGGIGTSGDPIKMQVYTSEFGQQPCAAERALRAEREREWAARHPPPKPPPPVHEAPPLAEVPAPEPDLAQDYVAASARGIQPELLALVDDQLDLLLALHRCESLAPLAAYIDGKGQISGLALTAENAAATDGSVQGTLDFFREKFRAEAPTGRIVACAVFYHGCHGPGRGYPQVDPARQVDEADCIVARLDHDSGQAVTCVIQYAAGEGGWRYAPAYYALRTPDIFLDRDYRPLLPDRVKTPLRPRRPARASDRGTHPESMLLLESQMDFLKRLLESGSLAPLAATMKPSGEIQTFMPFSPEAWDPSWMKTDPNDPIVAFPVPAGATPADSARHFIKLFRAAAERGEIVASAILFHARYTTPRAAELGLQPAAPGEEPNCLVAVLDHRLSQAKSVVQRYARDAQGTWQFTAAEHHSGFPSIFNETDDTYLDPPS